ncbi:ATP-grasp domain-containing protein [Gemmata sp. G18]|uniref:ATP-grasp domain-containing protein n=1 Tax=Gemmata palustris TaxID=2822762 RepID=A0ABS5BY69_9BACT|nr:ATP-grasp domain-containing protein [Gemmata palustris]MBP3958190.1 ATP-grasp domain-containing protein [Gemmata palustris]
MTLPIWLIESAVYGSEIEPLAAEVRRQGMECRFVAYREIVKGPTPLPPGSCAITYGTYPTVRHAMLRLGWTPGGWCSPENLDCATYYPHFADFLLNQRHEIITGADAVREKKRLFHTFGHNGCVFARPTSVHKLFVGRLIAEDDFETALAPTRYDPETKVVIAEPRELGSEWRLVIANGDVVAASRYAEAGAKSVAAGCPDEVLAFARAMLDAVEWRPDNVFMLDVCESVDGLRLVELNSFSCSWLYACDVELVVRAASRCAIEAHIG